MESYRPFRPPRRAAFLLHLLLLGSALAGQGLPAAGLALLERGPEARKGLPFFSPNAIPCLYGEYRLGSELIALYYTRSDLVLSGAWSSPPGAGWPSPSSGLAVRLLPREAGAVLLLSTPAYRLFLLLPGREAEAYRRFALALERRFSFFFANAAGDAELSFPASVSFSP